MHFMLHAMLDATYVVLWLHYKSMKCEIIKIDRDFPKLWSQMYRHLFMVHGVDDVVRVFVLFAEASRINQACILIQYVK